MKKVFDNLIAKESVHAALNIQSWEGWGGGVGVNGKIVYLCQSYAIDFSLNYFN